MAPARPPMTAAAEPHCLTCFRWPIKTKETTTMPAPRRTDRLADDHLDDDQADYWSALLADEPGLDDVEDWDEAA